MQRMYETGTWLAAYLLCLFILINIRVLLIPHPLTYTTAMHPSTQLSDGRVVECVGIPLDGNDESGQTGRLTVCVSSQVHKGVKNVNGGGVYRGVTQVDLCLTRPHTGRVSHEVHVLRDGQGRVRAQPPAS